MLDKLIHEESAVNMSESSFVDVKQNRTKTYYRETTTTALIQSDTQQNEKTRMLGVSLVIPAYNESGRIKKSLDAYIPALTNIGLPFEIIVVIDGQDDTQNVVESYGDYRIKVHRFQNKLGRGGAILKGFQLSNFSMVGYTDADGSLSAYDLPTLIGFVKHYDCVSGSRWMKKSKWMNREPIFNSLAGRIYNLLIRGMLGVPLSDTEGGGKFFKATALENVISKVKVTNRAFTASLFYHLRREGFTLIEVPITWDHDNDTRMPILKAIPIMFFTLIGVRLMNLPVAHLIPSTVVNLFIHKFASI